MILNLEVFRAHTSTYTRACLPQSDDLQCVECHRTLSVGTNEQVRSVFGSWSHQKSKLKPDQSCSRIEMHHQLCRGISESLASYVLVFKGRMPCGFLMHISSEISGLTEERLNSRSRGWDAASDWDAQPPYQLHSVSFQRCNHIAVKTAIYRVHSTG